MLDRRELCVCGSTALLLLSLLWPLLLAELSLREGAVADFGRRSTGTAGFSDGDAAVASSTAESGECVGVARACVCVSSGEAAAAMVMASARHSN